MPSRNFMLAPKIQTYINRLTEKSPEITAIWLIGSRANGNAKHDSDWDLLVFGNADTYKNVENDDSLHLDEVDLLIFIDDEFSKPYGNPKTGSLKKWEWNVNSESEATYKGVKWIPDLEAEMDSMPNMGQFFEQKIKAVRVY